MEGSVTNRSKAFFRALLPYTFRRSIKRYRRRLLNNIRGRGKPVSISDIRVLIEDEFSIGVGDSVIVSSSFGNLNALFTPDQLIDELMDIVGPHGNIVMPFYPPGLSEEWVRSGKVFDMTNTPSSMGILTQKFSERADVVKSLHPIKAVVAWGGDAQEIVSRHHLSQTPFDEFSPYGWLLNNSSKSLGLGVKNNPMFHACEDSIPELHRDLYLHEKFVAPVKNGDAFHYVTTSVHSSQFMDDLIAIGDYIPRLNLKSYKRSPLGYSSCYVLGNQELLERCHLEFAAGRFRYKQ